MPHTLRAQRIAAAVKSARRDLNLTQAQLAEACGVHEQTIGNVERGLFETSPEVLAALTRVLGIRLTDAALAAFESASNVERVLQARVRELDDVDALMLVAQTLAYVYAWEPGDAGAGEDFSRRRSRAGEAAS